MTSAPVFKITPGINSYAWGKKGSSSLAAQLAAVSIPDFEVDGEKPYAEVWMGTHPTLPSKVDGKDLSAHLANDQQLVGEEVAAAFPDASEGSLPFLFKVLSIGTALSIQAHPNKELAKKLFKEKPDVYKDPNHKPEMAIALTPFLAFLNFLPLPTILLHLLSVPELESLVPSSITTQLATSLTLPDTRPPDAFLFEPTVSSPSDEQKGILKSLFEAVMSAPEEKVKGAVATLVARYKSGEPVAESEKGLTDLAVTLDEQYPGDVGVLCVFLLNVVKLKRGEAAFLSANMPHAYINGDIIECMATSDNVVRAGLTPKLRDVPTLISMLTYEAGPGSKQLLRPTHFTDDGTSLLYDPPIDEFSVVGISLEGGQETKHRAVSGPSIAVVTEGNGTVSWEGGEEAFKRGEVVFIGAGAEVGWKADDMVEVFRAYVEADKA